MIEEVFNLYLDKRGDFKKNSQFKVDDIVGDKKRKESISPEKKLN